MKCLSSFECARLMCYLFEILFSWLTVVKSESHNKVIKKMSGLNDKVWRFRKKNMFDISDP